MKDAPFELVNPDGAARAVPLCDHASNRVPDSVSGGDLGLPPGEMARHIAYDIGVRGVTLELSRLLDAPAVLGCFSRLVIDPNRGEDDPTLVMKLYDGTIIPANRHADAAEVERRLAAFHRPYHGALERLGGVEAETIRIKHFEGLTFEAVGVRLGIPTNTAKTRYYRGMLRLEKLLRSAMGRSEPGGER